MKHVAPDKIHFRFEIDMEVGTDFIDYFLDGHQVLLPALKYAIERSGVLRSGERVIGTAALVVESAKRVIALARENPSG